MSFIKTTEQDSHYNHLEKMSVSNLIQNINTEDQTVATAVQKSIPQIIVLTDQVVEKLKNGGRLFYIGAGTSGRLGILDASECPPTYGSNPLDVQCFLINGWKSILRNIYQIENENELIRQW